jgi:epsilon-lactone hydrolase
MPTTMISRTRYCLQFTATCAGSLPTILNSGTRDLLLSNTVRVHRNLRQAGVIAELHVHEGQAHGSWYRDVSAPESKEAFEEIARFFDNHLGK